MSNKWYCVAADGVAVLCDDKEDALEVAAESFALYPQHGPYKAVRLVDADRIDHLERVLAQAREAMAALDLLFSPLARDCTAIVWIDKNSSAIAAIDEALNYQTQDKIG